MSLSTCGLLGLGPDWPDFFDMDRTTPSLLSLQYVPTL